MDFYNMISESVMRNENIVLLGKGGEGKTTMINQLLNTKETPIKMNLVNYKIFHEYHKDIEQITSKFILSINQLNEIKNLQKQYTLINFNDR
jgi:septin family protein